MGRFVSRESRPVSVEEEILGYEDGEWLRPSLTNTALWLLLHLDGRLERPDPINRLVTPSPRNVEKYFTKNFLELMAMSTAVY